MNAARAKVKNSLPKLVVNNTKPRRGVDLARPVAMSNWDRLGALYGKIIAKKIEEDSSPMNRAKWFTRETLVFELEDHPTFNRASTIHRYNMVCRGVAWLIHEGKLFTPGRSRKNLCVAKNVKAASKELNSPIPQYKQYYDVVAGIIQVHLIRQEFSTMTLVSGWYDYELTLDQRVTITRYILADMVKKELLVQSDEYMYKFHDPNRLSS